MTWIPIPSPPVVMRTTAVMCCHLPCLTTDVWLSSFLETLSSVSALHGNTCGFVQETIPLRTGAGASSAVLG